MADISTWSPVDESNTAAPPAGAPENMQPNAVNNTMRAMMGAIRRWYDTITAQLASITTSLGNYLPLTGGILTGNLSAPQYNLGGLPFATSDGTTSHVFDGTGGSGIHLQAMGNYYDADTHAFRNNSGTITTAIFDGFGNLLLHSNYIHFAASAGTDTVNATGGPLIFADNNNHVYKQGVGNGSWVFQNYAGTNVASIGSAGNMILTSNLSAVDIAASGAVNATGSITGVDVFSTTNLHSGGALYLGNPYILFNGNPNLSQGPYLQADNTDWIARLGPGNGHFYFANNAGVAAASIAADGTIAGIQLRGGNGASDAGVLRGMPTADPTQHTIAFGWDQVNSVFYKITDNSRTDTLIWSDTIRAQLLAADGGAPGGWRLGVYSGGTIFNIYVDFTASDARLKRGIADSEVDALTALCSVPVRKFEWLDEIQETFGVRQGPVAIGLVAQELLPHMPDVVGISEGRGAPYPEDTHTLMYDRIHAYTIRAIQQLAAENAVLAARVAALEGASHV